jgi:hypothetical protein
MGSEYFKAMASVAFNLIPIGLFLNAPGAFGYPKTTWGAQIKFEPVPQFYAMAGAYNGDPKVKEGNQHGLDFSLRSPLFAIGEVGFRWNYGDYARGFHATLRPESISMAANFTSSALVCRPTLSMVFTACTFWVIRLSRVGAIRVKIDTWACMGPSWPPSASTLIRRPISSIPGW